MLLTAGLEGGGAERGGLTLDQRQGGPMSGTESERQ